MSGRHKWDTLRQKVIERLGQERYDELVAEANKDYETWIRENPEDAEEWGINPERREKREDD